MSNERIDLTQFDWMEHHSIKHMEDTGDLAIVDVNAIQMIPDLIAELKRCYEELDEHDKLVGLLIENHFVETSPYETVKHLIETHQDYRASE